MEANYQLYDRKSHSMRLSCKSGIRII